MIKECPICFTQLLDAGSQFYKCIHCGLIPFVEALSPDPSLHEFYQSASKYADTFIDGDYLPSLLEKLEDKEVLDDIPPPRRLTRQRTLSSNCGITGFERPKLVRSNTISPPYEVSFTEQINKPIPDDDGAKLDSEKSQR